ncbi:endonuclease/exonuclease/phosphatase family protein [Hyphococcus sp.]|uniref:endonuclease/exonuclease/phosphatase family protein n=1 Tax=Hyphococcus sp. TaxID=2038636 RepID=UPI0035C6A938
MMAVIALACLAGCGKANDVKAESVVRFATFNVYLNRPSEGALIEDLKTGDTAQAQKVAEIIQRVAPDVLLLNEFDYDAAGEGLALFQEKYLGVSQNGAAPALYPYVYVAPSNTGLASGRDFDRDGVVTIEPGSRAYGGDAFGYGEFPGQYAMALLSKYPIDEAGVRTFQTFLWKDMPGAMLPDDAATPEPDDWYSAEALEVFRLSSKNHWDVPVIIGGARVHVLASHPTPPSYDGEEDRNGKRNHDELRLWADYIAGDPESYIYDDKGMRGGLAAGERFVIMGDLNADPHDAGAVPGAIGQLLTSPLVADAPFPKSTGGAEQAALQGGANESHEGDPAEDTADFNDDPEAGVGNLHLDYVIVSKAGLKEIASGVFWPGPEDEHYDLLGPGFPVESSDHRLVWRDLQVVEE